MERSFEFKTLFRTFIVNKGYDKNTSKRNHRAEHVEAQTTKIQSVFLVEEMGFN